MNPEPAPLSVSWADLVAPVRPSVPAPVPLARGETPLDELVGVALETGARDVARRMLAHGASSELVRAVLAEVARQDARGAFAIDAAAEVLARAVPILPSPRRPDARARVPLFAFVGPAGAGKTIALAKLGRHMRAGGRRVAFASLDPLSLSALDRVGGLSHDIDRAEVPLELVRAPEDLRRLARGSGRLDAVLLDTPGLSPRDEAGIDLLARELAHCTVAFERRTLLVLSAASSRGALRLATRAFAPFRADGAVLTKLDETDEPGAAVEALVRAALPAAFLCDGPDARAHLVRASGAALADLVLRGRLATASANPRGNQD